MLKEVKKKKVFLLFFSETTGPYGTTFGSNVHFMALYKMYGVFFLIGNPQQEKKVQRVQIGCFHIYGYK
jgi:hypothetical protein